MTMAELVDGAVLLMAVMCVHGGCAYVSGKPMTAVLRNAMYAVDSE